MLNNKLLIIIVLNVIIFIICGSFALAANLSDAFEKPGQGGSGLLQQAGDAAGYDTHMNEEETIGKVIQLFLSFVGVIFLILMIFGGYYWMTARGNEQQVEKAKNLITAAIIGLVIVLAAYAISIFIVDIVTKQTLSPPSNP